MARLPRDLRFAGYLVVPHRWRLGHSSFGHFIRHSTFVIRHSKLNPLLGICILLVMLIGCHARAASAADDARPAAATVASGEKGVFDIVIQNGMLIDGSGQAAVRADVGIRNGRIAAVGDLEALPRSTVVNAEGKVVCPGFVDLHSHADRGILKFRDAENYIRQGVTTLVCGNCGSSPTDVPKFFRDLRNGGTGPNIVLLIGHGSVRGAVVGDKNVAPTKAQLAEMRKLTRRAMEAGAAGMSTSLRYGLGAYAETEEVIAIAKELVPFGGFYATHMRDEGTRIIEALEEALRIGREAGIPVHVSHHKISSASVFGLTRQTLARIDQLRHAGFDVTLDQYPYGAGSGGTSLYVPQSSLSGGLAEFRKRIADPRQHTEIVEAVEELLVRKLYEAGQSPSDPKHTAEALARVQIARARHNPKLEGQNIPQILKSRQTAITLRNGALLLVELVSQGVKGINHTLEDRPGGDVDRVMLHPRTCVASDGGVFEFGTGNPHPRSYGCYPRVLGRYVRDRKLLSIERAIHKMTALPAERLGWTNRGLIKPGYWADVVVFDPKTVSDKATFLKPHQYSVGIEHVIVRGQFVLKAGKMTGLRPGRPVASVPSAKTPATKLRRDLLDILQSQDGRFGLFVTLPGREDALGINADDPFSMHGLTEARLSKPRLSVRELAHELLPSTATRLHALDTKHDTGKTDRSGRYMAMRRHSLPDKKQTFTVVLVYDGLSKAGLASVANSVMKQTAARIEHFIRAN